MYINVHSNFTVVYINVHSNFPVAPTVASYPKPKYNFIFVMSFENILNLNRHDNEGLKLPLFILSLLIHT